MPIVRVYEDDGTTLLAESGTDDISAPFNLKVVKVIRLGFTQSGWIQIPDGSGKLQKLESDFDD
jgi:hypothetical protein